MTFGPAIVLEVHLLRRFIALALLLLLPLPAHAANYLVQPGDTLGAIAKTYHVSLLSLARANGIVNTDLVRIGQYLVIPQRHYYVNYHVRWGDSLTGMAARFGTSIAAIKAANPTLGAYPLAGEWLRICRGCGGATGGTVGVAANTTAGDRVYVVRPGDNLSSIAARFGVSTTAVSSFNNIANQDLVVIGTPLHIPGSSVATVAQSTYDPWMARALIVQYAQLYGIDPALPLAIGWQESGFNESMISSTGAIGVMQVEPYTGATISRILGRTMNLYNVRDNVQAGVFWVSNLLRYYGGNGRLAAAAYYEGTRALAHHGFYADTNQYVADVLALEARFGG